MEFNTSVLWKFESPVRHTMESDSAMDSDSDAEAPEKRRMSYMYLFDAKFNYNNRDLDATTYMRRYLDLRRYKLKQPELIAFAAIDQEPRDDDTANTSNKSFWERDV